MIAKMPATQSARGIAAAVRTASVISIAFWMVGSVTVQRGIMGITRANVKVAVPATATAVCIPPTG